MPAMYAEPVPCAAKLEAVGLPTGPYDLMIAGQTRARALVLITANTREFQRTEGLVCEYWTLPE